MSRSPGRSWLTVSRWRTWRGQLPRLSLTSGVLAGRVTLGGTPRRVAPTGELTLRGGAATVLPIGIGLRDANATVSFLGDSIVVREMAVRAATGSGDASLSGVVRLRDSGTVDLRAAVSRDARDERPALDDAGCHIGPACFGASVGAASGGNGDDSARDRAHPQCRELGRRRQRSGVRAAGGQPNGAAGASAQTPVGATTPDRQRVRDDGPERVGPLSGGEREAWRDDSSVPGTRRRWHSATLPARQTTHGARNVPLQTRRSRANLPAPGGVGRIHRRR